MKWTHKELVGLKVEQEEVHKHPTVQGLRLRAYPSGRKGWQWARMMDGKALRKALGRFPAIGIIEAQGLAGELNDAFERGNDPTASKPVQDDFLPRVTVAEGWDRYIADCERRCVRSVHKMNLMGHKDIIALLGNKLLADVTVEDVSEIIARPITRARNVKRATQGGKTRSNAMIRTCRAFLAFCLKRGLDGMQQNAALAVDPVSFRAAPARTLTLREMALLIVAARELDRRYRERGTVTTWADAMSVLVLNGNRKSELFDAFGDEWDAETQLWLISADRYKTGVDCTLPVGPTTAAIFNRRAKAKEFIIPSQSGVRTGQDRHVCNKLTSIMSAIGGEAIRPWSMHSIRHGFRHNIRKAKIADSDLAEMIIHPKREVVMERRYDNDWRDEMRAALTAWDRLVDAEVRAITAKRVAAVA